MTVSVIIEKLASITTISVRRYSSSSETSRDNNGTVHTERNHFVLCAAKQNLKAHKCYTEM